MDAGFSETLLEHARYPHNYGGDGQTTCKGIADLDGNPPFVEIFLNVQDGVITSARFQAVGCGVTVACGSALMMLLTGNTLGQARLLNRQALIDALEGIPAHKLYCADVTLAALENALGAREG